ncbi:MAG: hypothetical protein ACPG5P_09325, partial [Saprospiraceae bacterium]
MTAGEHAITNWATEEVIIDDSEFRNFSESAILSYDAGMTITRNDFFDNQYGIYATATAPMMSALHIGASSMGNNFGNGNTYGILAEGINDTEISDNVFDGCTVGTYVRGTSQYRTEENEFSNNFISFGNQHTMLGLKELSCNNFDNSIAGLYNLGNNQSVRFEKNHFSTQNTDVWLDDWNNQTGVLPNQGNAFSAVWNYFSETHQRHIATNGPTNVFNYYHPNNSTSPRTKPLCSLNDPTGCTSGSVFNFNAYFASGNDNNGCDNLVFMRRCMTEECLRDVKERLELKQVEGRNNSHRRGLAEEIRQLEEERDYIIHSLVGNWMA